jgi:hypothetical protein
LDLSACTMSGTEFDPGTANTGEGFIVSLVLPTTAESITAGPQGNATFENFTALKEVHAAGVTSIGESAFSYCTALTTADFPEAITIGGNAFYYCNALTAADFPKATTIGVSAFFNCGSLTTVNISKAKSIGDRAFFNCSSLTTVEFPAAESIGESAFSKCATLTSIYIPAGLTSIDPSALTDCTGLREFTVASGNSNYTHSSDKTMLLSKDGKTLIAYPSASYAVTLDTSITAIGDYVFSDCTDLTTVNAPAVTSIGYRAFMNCADLTTVDFPKVTFIGESAFMNCADLTTVDFPKATAIGDYVFSYCIALTTVNLPEAATIGESVFSDTGNHALIITLGNTAPALGREMFYNVTSAKTVTVRVPSGAAAWSGKTGNFSSADTAVNWGNGFRGGGWDGNAFTTVNLSNINSNISLIINEQ